MCIYTYKTASYVLSLHVKCSVLQRWPTKCESHFREVFNNNALNKNSADSNVQYLLFPLIMYMNKECVCFCNY